MVLGMVVGIVITAFIPIYVQEFLCSVFSEPVIAHVPGLASFDAHGGVHERICGFVVGFDARWTLRMTDGFEGSTKSESHLRVVEEAAAFRLGSRTHNVGNDFALGMDGRVVGCAVVVEAVW